MGGGIGSILYADRYDDTGSLASKEFYHYNAVGHTVALSDSNALVTKTTAYDAYGNVAADSGQSNNNRLANTKERDASLGLDNHGFRYYDPTLGRYLTKDPIGYADGLNNYLHVHNNPVNFVDPLGLEADDPNWLERNFTSGGGGARDKLWNGVFGEPEPPPPARAETPQGCRTALMLELNPGGAPEILKAKQTAARSGAAAEIYGEVGRTVLEQTARTAVEEVGTAGLARYHRVVDAGVTTGGVVVRSARRATGDAADAASDGQRAAQRLTPESGWRQSTPSSATLRLNLGLKRGDDPVHHVVPGKAGAYDGRAILDRYQININAAENGISIPRTQHEKTQLHTNSNIGLVNRRLEAAVDGVTDWATGRQNVFDELSRLKDEIREGTFPPSSN